MIEYDIDRFILSLRQATKEAKRCREAIEGTLPNIPQRAEYPQDEIERDMPECEARNL